MIDRFAKKIPPGRRFSRREMLALMSGATAALLGWGSGRSNLRAADAVVPACVVRPEQTEGPYFVDEQLNRSDIRSEPSDNSVQTGDISSSTIPSFTHRRYLMQPSRRRRRRRVAL